MITFQPNCTFPTTDPSGFVDGPNIRSTMNIVWSCVSIIILSTWSVLHLTVPPDITAKSRLQWFRKNIYLLQRKLKWMGIMLVFPEYLLGIGTTNLFAAWVNNPKLKELAQADDVPWSITHTIFANMGGIAIRFSEPGEQEVLNQQCPQPSEPSDLISAEKPISIPEKYDQLSESPVHGPMTQPVTGRKDSRVFIEDKASNDSTSRMPPESEDLPEFIQTFRKKQERHLAGLGEIPWVPFGPHLALATSESHGTQTNIANYNAYHIAPLHGNVWVLDAKQLILARRYEVIQKLPSLRLEEIQDKSKSDGVVRLLAVFQVLWLIVQLIARRIANTPSSALEISTLAFSSCAFIIYMIEWPKPKDVGVPIYLDTDAVVTPAAFSAIAEAAPITFLQTRRYYIPQSCVHQVMEGRFERKHVDRLMIVMSILSITLFGGIHVFAWNLNYPTPVERLLWRISALSVAIAPTISALLVLLESVTLGSTDTFSKWSVTVLAPLYLSSRMYLLAESFRSLYFLPRNGFVATWETNSLHIG